MAEFEVGEWPGQCWDGPEVLTLAPAPSIKKILHIFTVPLGAIQSPSALEQTIIPFSVPYLVRMSLIEVHYLCG